jgi:BCD family chlorophyll transporter-like MFS transporter
MDNQTAHPTDAPGSLSLPRNAKIALFHVGSSMADILASGVWNRIVIAELGFSATPVGLLLALRYFLAPLSIWVGQRSDVTAWHGYRRLPYVWGGRLAMVLSYMLLGFCTVTLADNRDNVLAWAGLVVALVAFSIGSALSSTTYLSLIYDITPNAQRTRAVSVVWLFLIIGFAVAGIAYGRLLPQYSREGFLALFIVAPLIMGALWFVSLVGEEKPIAPAKRPGVAPVERRPFLQDLKAVWANGQTRIFFLFLGISTLAFYTQDSILEPFAGQVFNMPPATTNRFSAYWGSMALIGILVSLWLVRRFPKRADNTSLSRWGVTILFVACATLLVCAVAQVRPLVTIGLVILGLGLGVWTVGTLGLMMDMTRAWGAGLYLALWTVSETLARGLGTALGGVVRDVAFGLSGQLPAAYGSVFLVEVIGFALAFGILSRLNVAAFEQQAPAAETVLSAAMD